MLSVPFLIRLLCLSGASCIGLAGASAQESQMERRMDDKWRAAIKGTGQPYVPTDKNQFAAKTFSSKTAYVKDFYYPKHFSAKEFLTGNFKGSKGFWMGDFKYSTNPADTKGRVIPNATTKYDTKTMPVKTLADAGKGYAVKSYAARASGLRGKSQDKLDKEGPAAMAGKVGWQGNMDTMTLEQVRDLLNKTK